MRRALAAAITVALAGCVPTPAARHAGEARESVESLWDFAPHDASDGVVFHAGAFSRGLALAAALRTHETPHPKKKVDPPDEDALPPLATAAEWEHAGFDPKLEAAAFSWPDRDRGALFILPLGDRERFRAAFKAKTRRDNGREIDQVIGGYSCVTVIGRLVCAKKLADVDAAAASHSSPVAYGGEHLRPDDTGDIEIFATPAAPHVADMAKEMKDYGKLQGVASSIRLREDGALLHVRAFGDLRSPLARGLAGAIPSKDRPVAAGAPTVLSIHVDPVAATAQEDSLEDDDKKELIDQLTGDIEVTTSGRGLLGTYVTIDLKDAARVEAYVKKKCKDAGGFKVGTGLRGITVTDHGCSMFFDSKLALLPIALDPIPIVFEVTGKQLVVTIGQGHAPAPATRTLAGVLPDSDASFALGDQEAIVAFTKSPWIGPDVGAGDTFKKLFWFVGEDSAARIDRFNDVAAHVAQAFVAAHVVEDGVIVNAGFVTFDHDGPEVVRAYDAALAARAAGQLADYHQKLADIEKQFPKSLAAQRASEVRVDGPLVGAGVVSLGVVGVWLRALDTVTHLGRWKKK